MKAHQIQMRSDDKLAFQFFRDFSRFEYALKRCGFLRGSEGSDAKPDWNKYVKCITGRFNIEDQCLKYLTDEPPKKQIVQGDSPHWSDMRWKEKDSFEKKVLDAVCVVRNNLFHGEKPQMLLAGSGGDHDDRDKKLLEAGITVLHYCNEILEQENPC